MDNTFDDNIVQQKNKECYERVVMGDLKFIIPVEFRVNIILLQDFQGN